MAIKLFYLLPLSFTLVIILLFNTKIGFSKEKCIWNCIDTNVGAFKRKDSKKPRNNNLKLIKLPTKINSINSKKCSEIRDSILTIDNSQIKVICDKNYAYIISNTIPNHNTMNGIKSTNEQIPVPALNYFSPIKLNPKKGHKLLSIDASLGIAINGVPIYDYSAQGEINLHHYDPQKDTYILGQLDKCGGHAGRGDDYHYHIKPSCMIENMKIKSSDTILGWGYDGYPLFNDLNIDGTKIEEGELDICNGKPDLIYGYRYHTSEGQPYIFKCLIGEVDTKILPRIPPLEGQKIRNNLKPPRNNINNLIYSINPDGTHLMSYVYEGENYFSSYKLNKDKPNCFDFIQRTISNKGELEKATLCR